MVTLTIFKWGVPGSSLRSSILFFFFFTTGQYLFTAWKKSRHVRFFFIIGGKDILKPNSVIVSTIHINFGCEISRLASLVIASCELSTILLMVQICEPHLSLTITTRKVFSVWILISNSLRCRFKPPSFFTCLLIDQLWRKNIVYVWFQFDNQIIF